MIRFYSLFVTSDELLASPYVRRFSGAHDLTLTLNESETVNFLLQTPLPKDRKHELSVIYDPVTLELVKVRTHRYRHQTLVTVTLIPKELGSMRIGFSLPRGVPAAKHRPTNAESPLRSESVETVAAIPEQ
jgi:hypothetical protein